MKNIDSLLGRGVMLAAFAAAAVGCTDEGLLEVIDPDLVLPENVTGAPGAEIQWAGAVGEFGQAYATGGGGQVMYVGLMTDEYRLSGTFPTRNDVDRRNINERNGTMLGQYRQLHRARNSADNAVAPLMEFFPNDPRIAEMYSLAGYSYVLFAENYCSGVPFGQTPQGAGDPIQGTPTTTAEMYTAAIQRFDNAIAAAAAAGSTNQEYLARVGKARVLVNQGNYAAAAAEVTAVPTDWVYLIRGKEGGANSQRNAHFELNQNQRRWSLADGEGVNGILFRTNTDARVPWEDNGGIGFDESTPLYEQLLHPSWESDTPLANGAEARLIEAEAQLGVDDGAWLTALNDLRATMSLPALTDPGDANSRVALHFEERARWLFGTAHRLGDLRRMIRQYGFDSEAVFPTGPYFKGGDYGTDVNFPVPFEEGQNPNATPGSLCLDRSA